MTAPFPRLRLPFARFPQHQPRTTTLCALPSPNSPKDAAIRLQRPPARVLFGWGTSSKVAAEVKALGCSRALVLTTPQQVAAGEAVRAHLGELAVGLYSNATMHTPMTVTQDALKVVKELGVDCCVAVGGGSTIGLGKAIALNAEGPKIKQIVIPTTYAGSEATPIIGQSETDANGKTLKTTQKTIKVLPEVILYDIDLTMTLPPQMTVTSALNALAHAVEALWAVDANPIISSLAEQGIVSLTRAIPAIHKDGSDKDGRSDALFGAWACGTCLGASSMALHHKLAHVLGGSFGMPHAETHTVILPHAVAYNAPYAVEAVSRVAKAMNVDNAAQGLYDLAKDHGAPYSLKSLGFKEEDLEEAADIAARAPYPNPAPLEKEKLLKLLTNAFHGNRPE
ncbi:iron-containing alcohol dehydrogenase [Leucosporidium creatinivorum]|uniref:Iron-containing alcohol dehydrogenase n=1 Tax=Leucosporidium creatinivorum TaxID=106004 RepID=A0A1Y2DAM6_9BASI|nr:iron-containing alcohol dehydrogenase [Leucosporidium creatinivorum]